MIVLDTNVLSEPIKPYPSEPVSRWLIQAEPSSVYTTTISQAEILAGVATLPPGKRRMSLAEAADRMFGDSFAGRILPFDPLAAEAYATIFARCKRAGRRISIADGMIAAIVQSHRAILATRNVEDFAACGIRIVNPWKA